MTISNIRPLADYLLIEPLEKENTTPSGIVIPDTVNKEKPQEGKILAVGPDSKGLNEGNVVIYKKWGGTEIKIENKDYLLIKQEDILAVIEK